MAHEKGDAEYVERTHNVSRFCVEHPQIAWVLLIGALLWGIFGYLSMPQRKDPDIAVRQAVALVPWPGASAERIEQLVTKKIEARMAENGHVLKIESTSRTGIAIVNVELDEKVEDTRKQFDDIALRFEAIRDLPEGAGPITFIRDFGDTSLRSPMDAVVLKRRIELGSLVGAGAVGFVVADIRSVKAVFGVPDMVVAGLRLGQPLAVTTAALPDEMVNGRITAIAPSADPASRVFDVEVTIDNRSGRLRPGMIGGVLVGGGASPRVQAVLPLSAVVRPAAGADGYAVFVVEEQGGRPTARLRRVKLGDAVGNRIAVTDGVRTGERVIVAGAALTTDGEAVQIVP